MLILVSMRLSEVKNIEMNYIHYSTIGGSLIPPTSIDATIGVAYYPVMGSMPQWELPHTKVEQAHRIVGL